MKQHTKLFTAVLASSLAIAPAIHAAPLKFDFGTATSPVFPGFTQVTDKTLSDANAAFGFVKTAPKAYDDIRPNPLEGDFVYSNTKSTFDSHPSLRLCARQNSNISILYIIFDKH